MTAPGSPSGSDPHLSIVLTGRNDNFGGDFNERFFRALRFNHRNLTAAGVDHEIVFVEWGPIDGKPYLAELERAIQSWIDRWNDDPRPFVWTKTADQIFENITRYLQRISNSGH